MITFKDATVADIGVIQTLAKKIFPATYQFIILKEQIPYMMAMMYTDEKLFAQIKTYMMVMNDDKAIGYVQYEFNYKGNPSLRLSKLYVLPTIQGKGIGKTVMDKLVELAKAHNQTAIVLNVYRYNKAIEFYKKIGFVFTKVEDINIGNGYWMNDYEMTKYI